MAFVISGHGGANYAKWNDSDFRQFAREQPVNGGLCQGKSFLYEGGISVPMVVSCPGTTPAQTASNEPWYFADAMATFADIAAAAPNLPDAIDGQSVWPVLCGEREHLYVRSLHWESYNSHGGFRRAVRRDAWKLIRFTSLERRHPSNPELPKSSPAAYLELYDLAEDRSERTNMADAYPGICRELTGVMNETYTPYADYPLSEKQLRVFESRAPDDVPRVFPN